MLHFYIVHYIVHIVHLYSSKLKVMYKHICVLKNIPIIPKTEHLGGESKCEKKYFLHILRNIY